jgi:hypothetical protein
LWSSSINIISGYKPRVYSSSRFYCIRTRERNTIYGQPVYFQEWYAGIDIGGTGYRVFVPVVNKKEDIKLENLYFRNLEAKLLNEDGRYTATLKNPSTTYTFTKPEKPSDYPFDLKDNECVISYNENGKTKFHKIRIVAELAGAYYENGAPSISSQRKSATLATLDEDSGN